METDGKKLTVAEFAAKAGCSTQRIYQLLQNTLQPFAIVENGRKYILSDGLQIVLDARAKQGFTKSNGTDLPTLDNPCKDLSTDDSTDTQSGGAAELAALDVLRGIVTSHEDEIEHLRSELAQERQRREDAEKAAAVAAAERDGERKRADELAAILQQEQQTSAALAAALQAAQIVQAGQIRLAMNESADHTDDEHANPKRGFFSRIFKRKAK